MLNNLKLIHYGGRTTVTGSCHELRLDAKNGLLVDCGLRQGSEEASDITSEVPDAIDFPIGHIKAVVITHVHLDHVGRLPYLLAAGYKGPIYCSEPSAVLLPLVLEDALKVGVTKNRTLIARVVGQIEKQLVPLPYERWQRVELEGSCQLDIKLKRAGHILGSSTVMCRMQVNREKITVLFSGDLGAPYAPLLPAPKPVYSADVVVLESTYGDHCHEGRKNRRRRLKKVIERALKDRGVILVPAFSIGRTQELLYEIEGLIYENRKEPPAEDLSWNDLEIIVDSPLASDFTETYRMLRPFWDAEAKKRYAFGRRPLSFEQMTTIGSHEDHLNAVAYLKKKACPCIVIAASGMCSGGRIVNYLKELLEDSRTDVLFVGYQAEGTPGRVIQKYGPRNGYVTLDGKKIKISARIHNLSGYSAHADQANLINFIRRMRHKPKWIRLVHGEKEARLELKRVLEKALPGTYVD